MTHSHMPIQHLIRQVEKSYEKKKARDLPGWLKEFIDHAANSMEPSVGVARVGYDCKITEEGWNLSLFLGETEVVGGSEDGLTRIPNFDLNLSDILGQFESVESVRWVSRPDADFSEEQMSTVIIRGKIEDEMMTFSILDRSPESIGPGMRELMNGLLETI